MRVTIIGTGYVGLTTGVCLANVGHDVVCVDIIPDRVALINRGESPFYEPELDRLLGRALATNKLKATTELAATVASSEITLIAVGTPQVNDRIDLSYVRAAARQIGAALRDCSDYHVVAIKSTVVPGTTDGLVRKELEEASGLVAGEFGLCMNPEFLREGSALYDFNQPDRIVIGQWDERSGQTLARLYEGFDCPRLFTTLRNAEMIKYASNALLATLISFSNEIAAVCEATPQTDVATVLEGVHLDRRLSPIVDGERVHPEILAFLRAGCGFGGSCLPKDVNAFRAYARELAITPNLLDAVVTVNAQRPGQLIDLVKRELGALQDANVAVLGLAFKAGTDDLRESPSLRIIELLEAHGASVKSYDPMFASRPAALVNNGVTVCNSLDQALQAADAAIVVTAWPQFANADWRFLCQLMKQQIIIDGRNALRGVSWPETARYVNIGQHHQATNLVPA
jgi:UDPglucose 6-dehydrogenase/GDP-mannose 6-dehydrogenase